MIYYKVASILACMIGLANCQGGGGDYSGGGGSSGGGSDSYSSSDSYSGGDYSSDGDGGDYDPYSFFFTVLFFIVVT